MHTLNESRLDTISVVIRMTLRPLRKLPPSPAMQGHDRWCVNFHRPTKTSLKFCSLKGVTLRPSIYLRAASTAKVPKLWRIAVFCQRRDITKHRLKFKISELIINCQLFSSR